MSAAFVIIVLLVTYGFGFGSAWKVNEWKHEADAVVQERAQAAAQAAEDARMAKIAAGFGAVLTAMKASKAKSDEKVTLELSKAVYTQCVLPDSGRVLLNSNANDVNTILGLSSPMPTDPGVVKIPSDDGGTVAARQGLDDAIRRLRSSAKSGTGSGKPTTPSTK